MNWIDINKERPQPLEKVWLWTDKNEPILGTWDSGLQIFTWCGSRVYGVTFWARIEPPPKPPREKPTGEKLIGAMEFAAGVLCNEPDRDKISKLAGDYYVKGKRYFVWVQLEAEQP